MGDTTPSPIGQAESATEHVLTIQFSGSGSEYFRIWIVNLMLTLVTLGLYHPWAKVRRLRYFYGNTTVQEQPFDFHGNPKRMLRGFLLVGALVLLYSVAGRVSPMAGLIAFVIVAAVWPALFRAALRFRLANTSWRGLRFRFNGDTAGAYRAMLPLFIPGVLLLAAVLLAGGPAEDGLAGQPGQPESLLVPLALLASALLFPMLLWMLKKYQHDHYAFGQVQTELRVGAASFYALALKAFGVMLLAAFVAGIVAAIFGGGAVAALMSGGKAPGTKSPAVAIVVVVAMLVLYAIVLAVLSPYLSSRSQNLVWNGTMSRELRFESALRFWPLLRLTLKNWMLILVTLGLYGPFASIAVARLRLEAMRVHTRLAPDELFSALHERSDDAAGDAAGDLFGIDIGW